jgi:hypothetical protein
MDQVAWRRTRSDRAGEGWPPLGLAWLPRRAGRSVSGSGDGGRQRELKAGGTTMITQDPV